MRTSDETQQPTLSLPRLLTTQQAAELLHKPAGTLRYWRCAGYGPAYAKLGRAVVYNLEDLVDWVKSNTIRPSARDAMEEDRAL